MKEFFKKIVEAWYAFLPFFILLGIPCIICMIIGWEHILKIIDVLRIIGNGSFLLGLVVGSLKIIGIFNCFVGFLLTLDAISKKMRPKWFYLYIILTALSILAYRIYK